MITRRTVLKSVTAAAALAALPRLAFAQDGTRPSVVIAIPTEPGTLDPLLLGGTAELRTLSNIFDGLLQFDFTGTYALKQALATSWKRIDDLSVEFTLRDGVKFHDGSIMTADDVVFSMSPERKLGPDGSGANYSAQYQRTIAKVEATGPGTVRVTTSKPDPSLEQKMAAWTCQIASKAAFEKAGSWEAWLKAPIGAGPYRIVSSQKDVGLVLEAHDDYWGGKPPFQRVEFRIVPEASSRINGLLAGDYDVISDVSPDQFANVEANTGLEVVGGAILNPRMLVLDTKAKWLSDVRIRKALTLGIDRDLIVEQLWDGRITVPNGAQYPSFGDLYFPENPKPEFNPDEAKRLVAESGYDGSPITYKLLNNYYPLQVLGAQAMVEMWKAVGLNVEIRMFENMSQITGKAPVDGIYDSSLLPAWPDPTSMVWRSFGPGGTPDKLGLWHSEKFITAGQTLEQSFDPATRKQAARDLLDAIQDEVPLILLFNNGGFFGKKKSIVWQPYDTLIQNFGPSNPSTGA